jgi:hypothetical protein
MLKAKVEAKRKEQTREGINHTEELVFLLWKRLGKECC